MERVLRGCKKRCAIATSVGAFPEKSKNGEFADISIFFEKFVLGVNNQITKKHNTTKELFPKSKILTASTKTKKKSAVLNYNTPELNSRYQPRNRLFQRFRNLSPANNWGPFNTYTL